MINKYYRTKRLILIPPNIHLASNILDFYIRNIDFFKPFDPYRPDIFYSLSAHKGIVKKELKEIKAGRMLKFWLFTIDDIIDSKGKIVPRFDKSKILGMISFSNIVRGNLLSCSVAYKLDREETKKGYMIEALDFAINIIFTELKLHRIEANIMPRNRASIKLVKKLGFNYEGTAHKYLKINGSWEDHIHMVKLNNSI